MPTSDDYARAIINTGKAMGITPRGQIIGLATSIVEVGFPLKMYANAKVPESLKIPHDAVGSDGKSVGLFQQQIVKTAAGYWWADAATCMNPEASARLFFERLAKTAYNSGDKTPGWYAQYVQGSAFPERYDQKMETARALYVRLTGSTPQEAPTVDYGITKTMHGYNANSVGIGNSNGPRAVTDYFVVHTQQAKGTAVNLCQFCNNSATTNNPVAYNLAIDGRDTVENVPLNEGPWAAAEANDLGVHACIAGSFAEWTYGQWVDAVDDSGDGLSEDLALDRLAKALVAAHLEFGIPLEYTGDNGRSGWPKARGVVGHVDFGRRGGGHTDPGVGFPFAELIRRAKALLVPNILRDPITVAEEIAQSWIGAPVGGVTTIPGGQFREYANAHIYRKDGDVAAYAIPHGGLFEAWASYGFETGPLGWPRLDFTKLPEGAVQAFTGGVLLRKDGAPNGYPIRGVIGDRYAKEGFETGDLGFPTSDEYPTESGGISQNFERGRLDYDASGAVKTILKGDK